MCLSPDINSKLPKGIIRHIRVQVRARGNTYDWKRMNIRLKRELFNKRTLILYARFSKLVGTLRTNYNTMLG